MLFGFGCYQILSLNMDHFFWRRPSRTKLWMLAKAGKIRSVSLQEPGMSRATRLFCVKSIEEYIESFLPENQTKGETE